MSETVGLFLCNCREILSGHEKYSSKKQKTNHQETSSKLFRLDLSRIKDMYVYMFVFIYIDFLYVDVYLYVHLYLYMYVCICFYCCKCMHVSTYDTKRLSALKPCKLHLYPPSIHFVYLIMIPFFLFPNSERDKKQNSPLSRKEGRHVKKKQQSVSQFRRFDSSGKQQQQSAAISSAG